MNFKFSGKRGQNNKVLETLRDKNPHQLSLDADRILLIYIYIYIYIYIWRNGRFCWILQDDKIRTSSV